jgi:hypothetical protein
MVLQPFVGPWPLEQHKHRINEINIHALSEIRAQDLSVRASEDISCLRQSGHCDRHVEQLVEWKLAGGKHEVLGKRTRRSATTNSTWPDLGSNPGRRGGNPAANRLSYGMALKAVHIAATRSEIQTPGQLALQWRRIRTRITQLVVRKLFTCVLPVCSVHAI